MFIIFLHHCSWYWDIAISRYLISWYGGFPPKRVNCLSMFASVYSSWWNRKLKGCTGDQVIIIIIIVCKYMYLCICVFVCLYSCISGEIFLSTWWVGGGWGQFPPSHYRLNRNWYIVVIGWRRNIVLINSSKLSC